jgi:hypothetical protein
MHVMLITYTTIYYTYRRNMADEKMLLLLRYLGKEPDLEPKIIKKTLKGIGVKEVYLGKAEDNATHITCFAKWNSSKADKKKEEIERKIPNMKVVQMEPLIRI